MLELKVVSNDVSHGTLAVAWCISPEALKELVDRKLEDPQVVIVVAPTSNYHIRREYRKVVPLKDLMTYLEVRASGENKIWAFISTRDKKNTRAAYLTKESGQFNTDVLDGSGQEWSYIFQQESFKLDGSCEYIRSPKLPAVPVAINVPNGVFAKEPAKWEKTWVNHWFRSKPADQCDFRRRRLLAYTVQPVVISFDVLVRTLILLASTLWLSRGMTLKYVLHPLSYDIGDAATVVNGGSWAIAHLPEDDLLQHTDLTVLYVVRKLWKLPLMPLTWFPMWLVYHFHVVIPALISLVAVFAICTCSMILISGTLDNMWDSFVAWFKHEKGEPELWYLEQDEMDTITCNQAFNNRTSVSSLPAKHRTIRLRFEDLKSKVCRPFSA